MNRYDAVSSPRAIPSDLGVYFINGMMIGEPMTLSINLKPEEEARLRERAAADGKDLQTFVREAALEKADRPSLAELLAPIHRATEAANVSIEEIDAMADRARREVREAHRSPSPGAR